jgi:hypothetical protein
MIGAANAILAWQVKPEIVCRAGLEESGGKLALEIDTDGFD